MNRLPAATRKDHRTFCETEGWHEVRKVSGNKGHHNIFELELPDTRVLRTRISHPIDAKDAYAVSLFKHILRDQLEVTAVEFWDCVRDGKLPDRGSKPEPQTNRIPVALIAQLQRNGVSEKEISSMSKQEAIDRMNSIWSDSE